MMTLGITLGIILVVILSKRRGYPTLEILTFAFFTTVVGGLSAKIYNIVIYSSSHWAFVLAQGRGIGSIFSTAWRNSGMSILGAIIGFFLFGLWYIHRAGLPRWPTIDIAVACFPLGQAVGRVGCFLNGCCYGRPTRSFLGVKFPRLDVPVHPTQLYEMVADLAVFVVLMIILARKKFDGQVSALYLILYAAVRFGLEYFRGDPGRGYLVTGPMPVLSFSVPQGLAVVALIAGIGIFRHRRRFPKVDVRAMWRARASAVPTPP